MSRAAVRVFDEKTAADNKDDPDPVWMTPAQTARRYQMTERSLYRFLRRGEWPQPAKFGQRMRRFNRFECDAHVRGYYLNKTL